MNTSALATRSPADAAPRVAEPRLRFGLIPHSTTGLYFVILAVFAVEAYTLQSYAWPLWPGRDAQTYLMYYLEMGAADPVFPQLMLFRTPLAPLFFGLSLDLGGAIAAEAAMGICYVVSILAVYCAGSFWSRWIGLGSALALLAYPAYGALYHNVSSDGLFAFGIAVWAPLICATAASPRGWKFALNGLAIFLLVMIRPSALLFVPVFAAFPFLLRASTRERLRNAAVFVVTAVVLLLGWSAYNSVRYGDFTISRMSAAQSPLYRLLSTDRLIDPSNGPASRDLARAIESDLLPREPYRSYGITLDEFLHTGRIRMWSDLAALSDRTWGWDSDYGKLRSVAREAITEHPLKYARGVWRTAREEMVAPYTPSAKQAPPPLRTIECEVACSGKGFIKVRGKLVPEPWDQSDPIPRGYAYWLDSTPDNSISTDWSSLAYPEFRFEDHDARERYERLSADLREMVSTLPSRDGSFAMASRLNRLTKLWPSMLILVLLGAAGLLLRPQRQKRILVFVCALGLAVVVGTALGSPAAAEYRVPVDPLFILFAVAAVIGGRGAERPIGARAIELLGRRLGRRSRAAAR
jgi:hypothetical protein